MVDRDAAAIGTVPPGILGLVGDVADPDDIRSCLARITAEIGSAQVLMTSAGVSVTKPIEQTSLPEWERVFRVNVTGTFLWIQAVLPTMQRGGSIVTVASQLAVAGGRGNVAYIASKGAVISMTRTLALDLAPRGIRVNAVLPGATETPLLERSFNRRPDPGAARAASVARHPLERLAQPEEVAEAALFLASDASSFTTGVALPVDGGWLAA